MNYSKIIDRIIRCIFIATAIAILYFAVSIFGFTELKMFLPWNKATAVQLAEEYYYQNYEREIKYSHTEVLIAGETWKPYYHYYACFYLEDENDLVFEVVVDYDYDTGQYTVLGDTYLTVYMKRQMRREISDTIGQIYGTEITIGFEFDCNSIKGEETTLEDLKKDTQCFVSVNTGQLVTDENKVSEAKKLYLLCNKMGQKGYQVKTLRYKDNGEGMFDYKDFVLPQINSMEDIETFIDEVNKKTVE